MSKNEMSNLTVTAIIPTYNRAHYLPECLDSLLGQSYPLSQIIVVNDGSTDNTIEVVQGYGDKVQLIDKDNGGKSSAINMGLEQCTSDYVWICDDDDVADLKGLESLIDLFKDTPDADIAIGQTQEFYEKDGVKHYIPRGAMLRDGESNIHLNFLEKMRTGVFAMLVQKKLYDRVGSYNPEFIRSQDYEMTLRLMRKAKIVATDHIIYYYRQHNETRGSAAEKTKARDMQKRWLTYNRRIFEQVEASYDFEEFTPTFALSLEATLKERATHIQRAVIFLNHGLWDHFVRAYGEAVKIAPDKSLSENEKALAASAFVNEITLDELWKSESHVAMLKEFYCMNENAAELLKKLTASFGFIAIKKMLIDRDAQLLKASYDNLSRIMGTVNALTIFGRTLVLSLKSRSLIKKLKAVFSS